MYNYIDEVPETIQDKVAQMTEDYDWWQADYFENADTILSTITPTREEVWADFDRAAKEAKDRFTDFLNWMAWTPEDYQAALCYCDALPERVEQEELDELHDIWLAEELAWYNHARMMGWE